MSGTNARGQLASRSSWRDQTVQGAWDQAVDAPQGGKFCPSCGTTVNVAPKSGIARDWDMSHNPSWTNRTFEPDIVRSAVIDDYNEGVMLECPQCNRSAGNNDSRFGGQ
ncbi:GH-E family nuclease [Subtercola vilae]|uniref:GH-E family nuclease n=1 Tax=Subtercola vilae TaxID=2056433 RepID=UPI003B834842